MDELQRPGAGLPAAERFLLNALFKTAVVFYSDRRALSVFLTEADTILRLVDEVDISLASDQVLVPRFQGMEDSSRNWSLLMVLEHLRIVNQQIMRVMDTLVDGVTPRGEIDIADYKPDPEVGLEVVDQFRQQIGDYRRWIYARLESHGSLKTTTRFSHPWFGSLDAHGWHCLAAIHQGIHRKQARKIVALSGIA